jgi:transposase-like protein
MSIYVRVGTKLCPCCKQRKPVKGSVQTRGGQMVRCAECKEKRLARTTA